MKKAWAAAVVIVFLFGLVGAAQHHYAAYYNTLGERDLELSLISTSPETTQYLISVHDAYGAEIWSYSGELGPGASDFVRLGDYVTGIPYAWGVVVVDSSTRLVLGLEYSLDGELVSVDTVSDEIPVLDSAEPFWLGGYYTQVGKASTAYIVMNPWSQIVTCAVTAYNSAGKAIHEQSFTLAPYESEVVNLTDAVGHGNLIWGLLNVRMQGRSVVLGFEYSGRGAGELEVENVTLYYY